MRYFKKSSPRTPIWSPNGDAIHFHSVDGKTGYYQTDDSAVLAQLDKCMAEGRGGLKETTAEDYDANWTKKKQSSTRFAPRSALEAIGGGVASDTMMGRVIPPLAPPAEAEKPVPPAEPKPVPVKARVGKRPSNGE